MIIIHAAPKRFPFSPRMDFKNLDTSGLQIEEDYRDDPALQKQIRDTHPFMRTERGRTAPPNYMRWMWHPRSGEMLVNSGTGQHAEMLANYNRKLREQGKPPAKFEDWLRGFYVPKTNDLAMRPYYVPETKLPFSQFPVQANEPEQEFDPGKYTVNEDMQWHARDMLQKSLGKPIPQQNFHTNVDNDWLATHYRDIGGTRW